MNLNTLYHGTIYNFDEIDLNLGKGFKDFGKGFYMTKSIQHAESMAKRNAYIETQRLKKIGDTRTVTPYLHTFEIDFDEMKKLNVKEFIVADKEWIEFVLKNRANKYKAHDYDVVIGPTADDTKMSLIAYNRGTYGVVGSEAALNILISMLEIQNLSTQYYFGSEAAVKLLKRVGNGGKRI